MKLAEPEALGRDERGVTVWGHPVDPIWLQSHPTDRALITEQAEEGIGSHAPRIELRGWKAVLAWQVADALHDVLDWQSQGICVAGRDWFDLGAGFGHYSVALRLQGANRVTMVDLSPPRAWSAPVLQQAGVEVVVADVNMLPSVPSDSVCLVYDGPTVGLGPLLARSPRVSQIVVDHGRWRWDRRLSGLKGWRHFKLGVGDCVEFGAFVKSDP